MIPSYTLGKTIGLGITLVALTYFFFYVFNKFKIKITREWILVSFLWVLFAAFVRVSEDMEIYPNSFFTVSPGILITLTGIITPLFLISYYLYKKFKVRMEFSLSLFALIGIIIHIPFFTKIKNLYGGMIILSFTISILAILIVLFYLIKKIDWFSISAIWAHMFDASATFTAIAFFGYNEQHIVPVFMINLFGAPAIFILKLLVVVPVVYLINKYAEDENLRKFLLLAVFAIGLAPALRDTIRLLVGV